MNEKIIMTKKGYEEYLNEIEKLKGELIKIGQKKKEAIDSAPGDGWHDNFAYEEAAREEEAILSKINELNKAKANIEIIETQEVEADEVNINDYVKLNMFMVQNKPPREKIVHLVVSLDSCESEPGVLNITIGSPVGKAIYKRKVGEKVSYVANEKSIEVEIVSKNESLEACKKLTLKKESNNL